MDFPEWEEPIVVGPIYESEFGLSVVQRKQILGYLNSRTGLVTWLDHPMEDPRSNFLSINELRWITTERVR